MRLIQSTVTGVMPSPAGSRQPWKAAFKEDLPPTVLSHCSILGRPLLDVRLHYKTLEAKARLGLIPAMKEGKSWLFRLSLLDEYIDRQLKSNVTNHAALAPNRKDQEP